MVRSPLALRCSKEQNALHTLIHQRHLTPSCGGHCPYRGENPDPGKDVHGELDPWPGIREQPRSIFDRATMSHDVRYGSDRYQIAELQQWAKRAMSEHHVVSAPRPVCPRAPASIPSPKRIKEKCRRKKGGTVSRMSAAVTGIFWPPYAPRLSSRPHRCAKNLAAYRI